MITLSVCRMNQACSTPKVAVSILLCVVKLDLERSITEGGLQLMSFFISLKLDVSELQVARDTH